MFQMVSLAVAGRVRKAVAIVGSALLLAACGQAEANNSLLASATPVPSGLAADIVIPPNAQAAPDFTLTDQTGQRISLSAFKGKVVTLTFLDSNCKQLCPLEGDQLGQAQRALGSTNPMTLLVVSVAPATDTPASEQAFASTHHWSADWHWLNGPIGELNTIWKEYSIAVQNAPGNVLHSSVVYLIDQKGFERAGWAAGLEPDLLTHDVRLLNRQT